MTEKEFTDLANKHLTVLESYQLDENGNSQFNIFGLKQLYEAITVTHCCTELKDDIKFERKSSARVFNNEKGIWEFI